MIGNHWLMGIYQKYLVRKKNKLTISYTFSPMRLGRPANGLIRQILSPRYCCITQYLHFILEFRDVKMYALPVSHLKVVASIEKHCSPDVSYIKSVLAPWMARLKRAVGGPALFPWRHDHYAVGWADFRLFCIFKSYIANKDAKPSESVEKKKICCWPTDR
jgi:hypothetical protein